MQRQTRDKFVIATQKDVTSGNACLETPPAVFAKLQEDFGPFDLDLCADAGNHLCDVWFGPCSPYHENALIAPWGDFGETGYANPPYGPFVGKMLRKAKEEAAKGVPSTLLLPVRITKAFHAHILCGATEVWFCDKRIAFWQGGAPKLIQHKDGSWKPDAALFDSMIVRYEPGMRFSPPKVRSWKVPKHTGPMGWG
jgi:hypothetical protein